ncbi:hypothetical protein PENSPDRAFT_647139 [Peniophora sp. CONT]|nr:hypothetical protein PENSPDRAFT_647139 [Peniophora sp. CONT]
MVAPVSVPFWPYQAFFVYIEPLGALLGAVLAGFRPDDYLHDLLEPFVMADTTKTSTSAYAATAMLANLWLFFAVNEYLVLSGTRELKMWRRMITGLLVADCGHFVALGVYAGSEFFWQFWRWNALTYGHIAFAEVAAVMRVCFILGVGIDSKRNGRQNLKAA